MHGGRVQAEAAARVAAQGGLDPAAQQRRLTLAQVVARQRALGLDRAAGTADLELDGVGWGRWSRQAQPGALAGGVHQGPRISAGGGM